MEGKSLVIDISPCGVAQALHMDFFNLGFLGKAKVERASEIHFDEGTQLWDIILPGHTLPLCYAVVGFEGYDKARGFEVIWLQNCRRLQINPYSFDSIEVAERLRESYE